MDAAPPRRLGSIDALRGLTVAAMLLVNNPGDWSAVFAPLRHADWHGCTPTDLVFPFFLFLVGVSMAFSVAPRARDAAARPALARGVLQRALRIALAGVLLHLLVWWALHTHHFRIWGVLQRIALCAAVVGVVAVYVRPRTQVALLVALLVGYTVLLGITALVQIPALNKKVPYQLSDLAPVSQAAKSADLVFVPRSAGITSLQQFVAKAKAQPGKLNYGSYGNATSSHLHGEQLKLKAGIAASWSRPSSMQLRPTRISNRTRSASWR